MKKKLTEKERNYLIEWLSVVTGYNRSVWEKDSDEQVVREYNDHVFTEDTDR